MDEKLIALADERKADELSKVLKDVDKNQVDKLLEDRIVKETSQPIALIKALLYGYSLKEEDRAGKWLDIYLCCINCLQKKDQHSKVSENVIDFLIWQVENLTDTNLVSLLKYFVEIIKTGNLQNSKILELFPKLLSVIATREKVPIDDINWLKGSDFKSQILNKICSNRWNTKFVIQLVDMLKDVQMSSDELEFVIDKTLRIFPELDLYDLPALVLNLLLLSIKGHQRKVLEGIMDFFIERDNVLREQDKNIDSMDLSEELINKSTLRNIEGTVIFHSVYALKQDNNLMKEFVKFLKMELQTITMKSLTPFVLAMSLTIGQVFRFKDQIFTLLKSIILKSFSDAEQQQRCTWLHENIVIVPKLDRFVLEVIENSTSGWDNVVPGLVQLGFILMDSFGPKSSFGRVEGIALNQPVLHQKACNLGLQILLQTFKVQYNAVRENILDMIFTRIGSSESKPITHILDLFSRVVKTSPQLLLNSDKKLTTIFDHLPTLPPKTAASLLDILQPILKFSRTLRDTLMLLLRKSMFSKHLNARKVSARGFLMILKQFRIVGSVPCSQMNQTFSLSQLSVDVHSQTKYNPVANSTLCLEIVRNLRRCLSQQAEVRVIIYSGLCDCLSKNSKLQKPILNLLLHQIKKYFEAVEYVIPPLRLEACLLTHGSQIYLGEPLAHLLRCVSQCVLKSQTLNENETNSNGHDDDEKEEEEEEADGVDDDEESNCLKKLEKILASLTQRMVKCELEEFELDKASDYSTKTNVGVKNTILASLILGLYESLMEYNFFSGKCSESSFENVMDLFAKYVKLTGILKTKMKGQNTKINPSLLSLHFIVEILHSFYEDSSSDSSLSLKSLKENKDFVQHILSVGLQKIHLLRDHGFRDDKEQLDKDKLILLSCRLGRLCLKHYQRVGPTSDKKNKKTESTLCLEILSAVVQLLFDSTSPDTHKVWFTQLLKVNEATDTSNSQMSDKQSILEKHTKLIQRLAVNILSSDKETKTIVELNSLLEILGVLCEHLNPGQVYEEILHWIDEVARSDAIDADMNVISKVLGLLLKMSKDVRNPVGMLKKISRDLHSKLGDIDKEYEVEEHSYYGAITSQSSNSVLSLVLAYVSSGLDEINWILQKMKMELYGSKDTVTDSSSQLPSQHEDVLSVVCTRLASLVAAFHELVQTSIPNWSSCEQFIKQLTNLYSTFCQYIKYYLQVYNLKVGHLTQMAEKLVKLIGTQLTPQVYVFITYIQREVKGTRKGNGKEKKATSSSSRPLDSSIVKQGKVMPKLIFAIENYEKFLVQLAKKSKVNLMEHVKPSVARDFRINGAVVRAVLQEMSNSEDDSEDDENKVSTANKQVENVGSSKSDEPPSKKARS
ncbi:Hypothetical predicted protein [Octopus vulgaris]|uniref:Fanconi anemia group I protein n=2 Tax=Octopus vulgaris TaxID=6645 RepID=A0AA36EZ91_OCTVU|nr:Hypothetical predicted protein [Octopus vulgaris]